MTNQIVTVHSYAQKGYGIADLKEGGPVEIAHTVVGDQVEIFWKKKRHPPQKGRLLQVLKAAENRETPRCCHVGVCGGCCWQQMSYEAQLKEKRSRVEKIFQRPVESMVPASQLYHYRNKMEFTFSENRAGTRYLGLMIAQAEPYVFHLEECPIGAPWFALVVQKVRAWWESTTLKAYDPPSDMGTLRYLTLRHGYRTDQKMVVLNLSGNPEFAPHQEDLRKFQRILQDALGEDVSIFVRIHQTKKGTPTQFYEMHLAGPETIKEQLHLQNQTLTFKISPASFFQPNTYQAEILYQHVVEKVPLGALVYDLYCGTGTIGMAVAFKARKVIGIELSAEAVIDARENCIRNDVHNMTIYQGDVGKVLESLQEEKPDVVILDPPRAGLDPKALEYVKRLLPKKIVYVSCNPLTQAPNISVFEEAGYFLEEIKPVDQFPHTYHIETIAVLSRR